MQKSTNKAETSRVDGERLNPVTFPKVDLIRSFHVNTNLLRPTSHYPTSRNSGKVQLIAVLFTPQFDCVEYIILIQ